MYTLRVNVVDGGQVSFGDISVGWAAKEGGNV
jgi:hypothetical protein